MQWPKSKIDYLWWFKNIPYFLNEYNVLEIICLVVLVFMFNEHAHFLLDNYKEMTDLQMAAMAQFPLAIWGMIVTVFKSINTELNYPELQNQCNGTDKTDE